MTTIINTPPAKSTQDNFGVNLMISVVMMFLVGAAFIYFIVPYISKMTNKGVQINVPEEINVTVDQGEQ